MVLRKKGVKTQRSVSNLTKKLWIYILSNYYEKILKHNYGIFYLILFGPIINRAYIYTVDVDAVFVHVIYLVCRSLNYSILEKSLVKIIFYQITVAILNVAKKCVVSRAPWFVNVAALLPAIFCQNPPSQCVGRSAYLDPRQL